MDKEEKSNVVILFVGVGDSQHSQHFLYFQPKRAREILAGPDVRDWVKYLNCPQLEAK